MAHGNPNKQKGKHYGNGNSDRPGLGWGMAESAAQDLESRGSRIDRAVSQATGSKKKTDKRRKKDK